MIEMTKTGLDCRMGLQERCWNWMVKKTKVENFSWYQLCGSWCKDKEEREDKGKGTARKVPIITHIPWALYPGQGDGIVVLPGVDLPWHGLARLHVVVDLGQLHLRKLTAV